MAWKSQRTLGWASSAEVDPCQPQGCASATIFLAPVHLRGVPKRWSHWSPAPERRTRVRPRQTGCCFLCTMTTAGDLGTRCLWGRHHFLLGTPRLQAIALSLPWKGAHYLSMLVSLGPGQHSSRHCDPIQRPVMRLRPLARGSQEALFSLSSWGGGPGLGLTGEEPDIAGPQGSPVSCKSDF